MGYKPQERPEKASTHQEHSSAAEQASFVKSIPGGNVFHTDNLPLWLQAEFERIAEKQNG
jgi:hypothetical protein